MFDSLLSNWDSLEIINLRSNQLSGTIPDSVLYSEHIQEIDFSYNSFHGKLPDSFKNVTKAKTFDVRFISSFDFLEGNFLESISVFFDPSNLILPSIHYVALSVGNNQLDGNLEGGWASRKQLTFLYACCYFFGCFCLFASHISASRSGLDHNSFNGTIPQAWSVMGGGQVAQQNLQYNHLQDPLPPYLLSDPSPIEVNLSHNLLSCPLPCMCFLHYYLVMFQAYYSVECLWWALSRHRV